MPSSTHGASPGSKLDLRFALVRARSHLHFHGNASGITRPSEAAPWAVAGTWTFPLAAAPQVYV